MTFFEYIKNILFLLVFLYLAPQLIQGIGSQFQHHLSPKARVGVISMRGVLYDSRPHLKQLESLFKDTSIKAIMIKMECNGSASGTGQTIFNEIMELKNEYPKPIITLVENICASGGYWIACATDHIIAPSTALIGSVGITIPYLFQLPELLNEHKVGYVSLKAGAYKTATDPFTTMSEDEKAMLQESLNDSYEQFTTSVANSRKLNLTNVTQWADGRIFNGNQARKLGLIDENGSLQNAIRILKEKALIEGEIDWVHPPRNTSLMDLIRGNDGESFLESAINGVCACVEKRYAAART